MTSQLAAIASGGVQLRRIRGLDGLRGISAMAVLLSHTLLRGTHVGDVAVYLFFVLSGFLITGILVRDRLRVERGDSSFLTEIRIFWVRRALRIFPAYYLVLICTMAFNCVVYGDYELYNSRVWYLLYLQNFQIAIELNAFYDFGHSWSLAVEQQYYLLFPFLVLFVQARRAACYCGAIALACFFSVFLMQYAGISPNAIYTLPMLGMGFLLSGGLASLLDARRLPRAMLASSFLWLIAGLVILCAAMPHEENAYFWSPYAPIAQYYFAPFVAILLFVLITLVASQQNSWFVRALEHPVLLFLGRISYGIYLVHVPIMLFTYKKLYDSALFIFVLRGHLGISRDLLGLATIAGLSIATAALMFHFVELPVLNLKRRGGPLPELSPAAPTAGL